MTGEQHRNLLVADALVAGLHSTPIKQRLLESSDSSLGQLLKIAVSMELAAEDAKRLVSPNELSTFAATSENKRDTHAGSPNYRTSIPLHSD